MTQRLGQGPIVMSYSLQTPTAAGLKAEARALREERAAAGSSLTHSAALEEVARRHGYRDWNAASAATTNGRPVPSKLGARVSGTYLGQPFAGQIVGISQLMDMQHTRVTVHFDEPVNVSRLPMLGPILRRRVTATLDADGVTASRTSDGEPHMRLRRA